MLLRKYEMPWRRPSELYAGAVWAGAVGTFLYMTPDAIPLKLGLSSAAVSFLMATIRMRQGLHIVKVRAALSGRAMEMISTNTFAKYIKRSDQLFLGFGFEWKPVHSQRLYDLSKIDYQDYLISPLVQKALSYAIGRSYVVVPQPDGEIGLPILHGVSPTEGPLYRPLQNFEGGTLIVGTTQSGKGVMLGGLLTQAIKRGDVVIILDPKNSTRLKRIVMRACRDYREPDTFIWFHPAFPEHSARIDFTFNWQKPTEIASRLESILPPDTAGAFTAFAWNAINVVVQGMVSLERRPNLLKLTKYIEGGIEPVLQECLRRHYLSLYGPGWRATPDMARLLEKASRGQIKSPSPSASTDLLAYVEYYEHYLSESQHDKIIDSQVGVFRHNREHYQKITANLLPILSMLTSGDLGKSLSPNPFDPHDERPIMNFEKIERGGHVLLMCLDSLPDPSVASAIGALALADLAARSGMRYNLGGYHRITLGVDEVSNVINQPLIEILNKGAEGGISCILAMQTLADLANRLGSENAARMALGNLNNLIAFRSKDLPTQEFIVEAFGKTGIHSTKVGRNTASDAHIADFTSVTSHQVSEELDDAIVPSMLGKLPNLQYFASVSGGRLLKGRCTLLDPGADVIVEQA